MCICVRTNSARAQLPQRRPVKVLHRRPKRVPFMQHLKRAHKRPKRVFCFVTAHQLRTRAAAAVAPAEGAAQAPEAGAFLQHPERAHGRPKRVLVFA